MTDHLVAARALAAVMAIIDLPHSGGAWVWAGDDLPSPDPAAGRGSPQREVLIEYLLDVLPAPASQTHRLRLVREFLGRDPLSRRALLRRHAAQLVEFDHLVPTYRLADVRRWRALCQFGDEEVYVAAAVAGALAADGLGEDHQRSLLARILAGWRVFIQPADPDFRELVGRGLHEAHVHLGELTPAPILWRLLMTGQYTPAPADPAWLLRDEADETDAIGRVTKGKKELSDVITVRRRLLDGLGISFHGGYDEEEWLASSPPSDSLSLADDVRHYLMVERELLVRGLLGVPRDGRPGPLADDELETALWRYVAARVRFMRGIVHPGRGFEAFARNRGLTYGDGMTENARDRMAAVTVRPSVGHLLDSRVCRADVRFAVRGVDGLRKITKQMGRVADVVRAKDRHEQRLAAAAAMERMGDAVRAAEGDSRKIEWHCVVAFSRGKGFGTDRAYGRRPARWRAYRRQVEVVVRAMLRMIADQKDCWPPKPFAALGIDMISSEFGFDPGIVAPAYRLTRCGPVAHPDHLGWAAPDGPRLIRCYHSGEDREHPITAARTTWEAITWLGLGPRDRVAHLIYLADLPADYAVEETAGERLDNLTWLCHLVRAGGLARPTGIPHDWLTAELSQTSDRVHQNLPTRPTADDLIDAWNLRSVDDGLEHLSAGDEYLRDCPRGVRDALLGYLGTDELTGGVTPTIPNVTLELVEAVYGARGRDERGEYPAAAVGAALDAVRGLLLTRGVDVETCPTSNQLIGSELTGPPPGAALFMDSSLGYQMLIGTDDPSMFKTDLAAEAAILVGSLLDSGLARSEAFDRVSRITLRSNR